MSSTQRALATVYLGYAIRTSYLLIVIPFYGRVLGAVEYGKVLAALSLFNIVWIVVNYAFSVCGIREIAQSATSEEVRSEFGAQVNARLILSVVGVFIGIVGTLASPLLRSDYSFGLIATALGLLQAFNLGWYFQGLKRFTFAVAIETLGLAITLGLVLVLVREPSDSIWVMASLFASTCITTSVSYLVAMRELGWLVRLQGGGSLISRSTALFVSSGISSLITTSSTYVLSLFASAAHVGYYGAAERVASVVLSLLGPANQVLVGTVSRSRDALGNSGGHLFARRVLLYLLGFGTLAALSAALLGPLVLPLLLGSDFGPSARVLQVLCLLFPITALIQGINLYVLLPRGMGKAIAWASIAGGVCALVGLLVFSRVYQGDGAAFARVVGELVVLASLGVVLTRARILPQLFSGRTRSS